MKRLSFEGIDYLLLNISILIVFQIKTSNDFAKGIAPVLRDAALSMTIGFSAVLAYTIFSSLFKKAQAVVLVVCILSNLLLYLF